MSHAKNKLRWCLNKAKKELQEGKISLELSDLEKVSSLSITETQESSNSAISIREEYQYTTKVSLENKEYEELLQLAKRILDKTKEILAG